MFLLMKCLLAGLSVIVLILTCLNAFDFGSNKLAVSKLSSLSLLLAPMTLIVCILLFPSFVNEGSLPSSYCLFFLESLYLAPVCFLLGLACEIAITKGNFLDLNRFLSAALQLSIFNNKTYKIF